MGPLSFKNCKEFYIKMVEVAGIEPASKRQSKKRSTCVVLVYRLKTRPFELRALEKPLLFFYLVSRLLQKAQFTSRPDLISGFCFLEASPSVMRQLLTRQLQHNQKILQLFFSLFFTRPRDQPGHARLIFHIPCRNQCTPIDASELIIVAQVYNICNNLFVCMFVCFSLVLKP